jgi:hypothetical protein
VLEGPFLAFLTGVETRRTTSIAGKTAGHAAIPQAPMAPDPPGNRWGQRSVWEHMRPAWADPDMEMPP